MLTSSSLPAWLTAEAMADTRAVWEPVYNRALSDDEIVGILLQADLLFDCLFGRSTRQPRGP